MIDVTKEIKQGTSQEILYADDLVFTAETMAELHEKKNLKSALECKDLKVNLVKTKVLVSKIGQINIKQSSKKDPCGIFDT